MKLMILTKIKSTGIGMIEVIAALLVISISLVTVNISTVKNLNNIRHAKNVTQASIHIENMAEMIRANPDAAKSGKYNFNAQPSSTKNCLDTTCTEQELAKFYVKDWFETIPSGLALAEASINVNGTMATIKIHWDNDNSGSTGTTCPPLIDTDKDCYQIEVDLQ